MIKTLANGVRIVYEENKNIRSCTVGIWVNNGSKYETPELSGISHFIEHMMFKGTNERTATEIANEMDTIGGQINAFTTKECTCYYVKALDIHLNRGINILTDMFFNSKFDNKDIDLERTVIEEEISMYEDQPEDVVIEKLHENIYKNYSLGMPILGTFDTLKNINQDTIRGFIKEHYTANRIVVAVCGSYTDEHVKKIEEMFSKIEPSTNMPTTTAKYEKTNVFVEKDIEQNHINIAFEGLETSSMDRYAMQIFNGILGGGMSSRLFQKVREENGLCYTIASFNAPHEDTGLYSIYVALSKNTEQKALNLIKEVIKNLIENGITDDEISRMREQIKANLLMGLESTSAKMNFLVRSILFHDRILTEDEIISRYDAVTKDDVINIAKKILDFSNASICVVGDVRDTKIYNEFLK